MQNNITPREASSMAAMPADLKLRNRMRILKAFRDGREYTAGDVSAATGISKLTVMRAIQFFCAKNVLVKAGKGSSTDLGGKKPECFRLNISKYMLSITLWPGSLNFALYDMLCRKISYTELPIELPDDIADVYTLIGGRASEYLRDNETGPEDLYGVGLSTAGTIDYKAKLLKYSSLNPGWGVDIPFGEKLRALFGDVEVFVENAGKMTGRSALLDESLADKRVLVLFTTWGVSACLIEKGNILNGKDSLIGEIGHMTIDPADSEVCGCGCCGCFERLIDIKRVRRGIAQNPPTSGPLEGIPPQNVTFERLFSASEEGDEYARSIVAGLAGHFARALRNITLVFNPDLVIFQGDYAGAGEYFDRALKNELRTFRYFPPDGVFETRYDKRSLFELDAKGAAVSLADLFFSDPQLYSGQEPSA